MPESDLLQILLSHDRWATAQLLDACGKLPADAFHQRFEIGPGSLHDTLAHMIAAMRTWTQSLAGQEPGPRIDADGQRRTADQLRALLEAGHRDFAAEARKPGTSLMVTRRLRDGRTLQLTRGAVLGQVLTHGTHHRAQCLNMLRRLGVTPLPPSSVAEWTRLGDPQT